MKQWLKDLLISALSQEGISGKELSFESAALAGANKIWGYFILFAIGLTLVYFIIEINKRWAFEGADVNVKSFMAPFLKLAIAILILSQAANIFSTFVSFNNTIVARDWASDDDDEDATDTTATEQMITDEVNKLGLVEQVVMFIPALFMWVIGLVINLVYKYKAILYKAEFLLRLSVTPIALGDVYSGQNANAIRWIKGFIALILYGACFNIIPFLMKFIAIGSLENCSDLWELLSALVMMLAIPFAEIGMLGIARNVTKEVMGA